MKNHAATEGLAMPKTLSQYVYTHLKDAILNNEIQARERIEEKVITERFHISRTPVREAINRLAGEGFIIIDQHRDAHVKDLSVPELQEIAQVMALLDGFALASILDRLNASGLTALEKLTVKLEKCFHDNNVKKFYQTNFAIHEKLWNLLPPGFLQTTLKIGASHIQRFCLSPDMPHNHEQVLKQSIRNHRSLLEVIQKREAKGISALMHKHWSLSY